MKTRLLFSGTFILLIFPLLLSAQPVLFQWAKALDHAPSKQVFTIQKNTIVNDTVGNVYSCGNFSGTVDFDPGPGVYNLTSVSIRSSLYFKTECAG